MFFSPDAHYFHVANTVLWHPIKSAIRPPAPQQASPNREPAVASAAASIHAAGHVTPIELSTCLLETMDFLRIQCVECERRGSNALGVWVTSATAFRIAFYEYKANTNVFLLLTDVVRLTLDLNQFQGRAFALPSSIHRHVVGDPGDETAFFEQFKSCPYSVARGDEARLHSREYMPLTYDYVFLRTEQALFDLPCFYIDLIRLIHSAHLQLTRKAPTADQQITAAIAMLAGVVDYFSHLLSERANLPSALYPENTRQHRRLGMLERTETYLGGTSTTPDPAPLLGELVASDTDKSFQLEWDKLKAVPAGAGTSDDKFRGWVACIFFFVSSGFAQSVFSHARRQGSVQVGLAAGVPLSSPGEIPQPPGSRGGSPPSASTPPREQDSGKGPSEKVS